MVPFHIIQKLYEINKNIIHVGEILSTSMIMNTKFSEVVSMLLTRIFHIRALTLLNVQVPCEILKRSLLPVLLV